MANLTEAVDNFFPPKKEQNINNVKASTDHYKQEYF